jgi:hypothetical protein
MPIRLARLATFSGSILFRQPNSEFLRHLYEAIFQEKLTKNFSERKKVCRCAQKKGVLRQQRTRAKVMPVIGSNLSLQLVPPFPYTDQNKRGSVCSLRDVSFHSGNGAGSIFACRAEITSEHNCTARLVSKLVDFPKMRSRRNGTTGEYPCKMNLSDGPMGKSYSSN